MGFLSVVPVWCVSRVTGGVLKRHLFQCFVRNFSELEALLNKVCFAYLRNITECCKCLFWHCTQHMVLKQYRLFQDIIKVHLAGKMAGNIKFINPLQLLTWRSPFFQLFNSWYEWKGLLENQVAKYIEILHAGYLFDIINLITAEDTGIWG